jgi:hypothetical protein
MVVEVGWYGISFVWYKKEPISLEGILAYNFNEGITAYELGSHIESITNKESIFSSTFKSVLFFYNFKESLLIPGKYFDESHINHQLNIVYGTATNSIIRNDLINQSISNSSDGEIYNCYRIPEEVHDAISNKFPAAETFHSTSKQIVCKETFDIYCIVFHNTIKVFIFKNKQVQFVQQFQYKTPEDVVYHLLNSCDKYNVVINEAILIVSGMIDVQSNLYHELYKYFLNINFRNIPDEVLLTKEMKDFPTHFFSHIIALAKCVS